MNNEQHVKTNQMSNRLNKFKMKLGGIQTKSSIKQIQCQEQSDSPLKLRLKKCSLNLKTFGNIDFKSEKSIKEAFQDHYELDKKLGEGGHSVVYQCRKMTDNSVYAVKFTRKNDPENLQSLKQQYRILVSLDHENIMKGHYLFVNQKKSFCHLICEYFDFPNLKQFILKEFSKGMPQQLAAQILLNILFGVQYLHSQKVCHRDLKPDNILFNPQTGQIKIIDFQIAKMPRFKHEQLQMWTKTGTPHYRSPQIYNGSYSQTTDIWSLGVIAYQMLTGKLPFKGVYDKDLIKAICFQELDYEGLGLSNLAINFLRKLLVKDSKLRITARQAISHPFILTRARNCNSPHHSPSIKRMSSYAYQFQPQQDDFTNFSQYQKSKFYDQNMEHSHTHTGKDIGIINCEQIYDEKV